MQLNSTRYQNNTRVVIGSPIIYQDDVVLLCDTSVGPVTINLLGIPYNYWNTQWALYIIDKSGNAGTNNITINAGTTLDPNTGLPVAQLINGASSQVINVNGGYGKITIGANTLYNAQFSFGGGGISSAYQQIQDEGIPVLPQRTILNFVGAGVTATDDGVSKTIVTIPGGGGGIVYLTNSALLTLIGTNAVVPGQLYMVTNPNYASNGVLLTGTSNNSVSLEGSGGFLNADYQKVGNYSGVPTFVSNLGIWWSGIPGVVLGSVVTWNNTHYLNTTGVSTLTDPASDVTNWTALSQSVTNGYILEWDFVLYNPTSNNVVFRADKRGNEVERFVDGKGHDTLIMFQWGRNVTTFNKVEGESLWDATNSNNTFTSNILTNGILSSLTPNLEAGTIAYNHVSALGQLSLLDCRGVVKSNNIQGIGTGLSIDLLDFDCLVENNLLSGGSTATINTINGGTIFSDNVFENFGILACTNINNAQFYKNYIANYGNVLIPTIGSSPGPVFGIVSCRITGQNIIVNYPVALLKLIGNKTASVGFSNFDADLDFTDGAIWDNITGTLTIPLWMKSFVGYYQSVNSAVSTNLSSIANAPTLFPFKIYPHDTTSLPIAPVPVSLAVLNNVIATTGTGSLVLTGRPNGGDSADFERLGNLNGLKTQTIYL